MSDPSISGVPAPKTIRDYTDFEEKLHAGTHGIATILASIGVALLISKAISHPQQDALLAVLIYGSTMIATFVTSTLYHMGVAPQHRDLFKLLDHIAIYFKISGGFTIYALLLLPSETAFWILAWTWGATALGTVLKVRAYRGGTVRKFSLVSLLFYLAMGWAGVLIIDQLYRLLPEAGFYWLLAGGLSYTVGTIFYAMKHLPYTHAIWHLFVMTGSACVFVSVYGYVI